MLKTGLNRDILDKFYTKTNVVKLCLNLVKEKLDINQLDLIIEPSAGNGSFINEIKELKTTCIFYDIQPENKEIIKQDYLLLNTSCFKEYRKIHIIGNPPFGRQSSSAIKFIKKSCMFCDDISFILPRSFKKDTLKRHFPLNFHLLFEQELENELFEINGRNHFVPCVFQIWEKRNVDRNIVIKLEPIGFKFVKKNENPDISFRRVGVNAGKIDTYTRDKNIQTHYFITFENKNEMNNIIEKLKNITFEHNNTVGSKSISKQELINKYNDILMIY